MREFMTRVSDYLSERREDPERKEDQLSFAVIVAVAVVIIVLLLLFWWGYTTHEKKEAAAAEKAKELQALQEDTQELDAVSYEEKMKEYLSQNVGDELRQEYLTNTNAMTENVRELETAMEKVQKEVTEVVREYHDSSTDETREVKETKVALTALEREVSTALANLKQTESKLTDLSDVLQVIDHEKLPAIDRQISAVRAEIERVRTDASGVSAKLEALEKEDRKLWERFSGTEQELKRTLNQNLGDLDSRLNQVQKDIRSAQKEMNETFEKMEEEMNRRVEEKIAEETGTISKESLSYRYDRRTNTLYLTPNQETKQEARP